MKMKSIQAPAVFMCLLLSFATLASNAQYRTIKEQYKDQNYSYESGDRYNPAVAAVSSVLIPGLGQMIAGEVGRGAVFLTANMAGFVTFFTGFIMAFSDSSPNVAGILMLGGAGLAGTSYVWSIVDAIQVTIIKNLYYRDQNKLGERIRLNPYIIPVPTTGTLQGGLQLSFRF
jgi:TM2 domain-containing membrane protein YozV